MLLSGLLLHFAMLAKLYDAQLTGVAFTHIPDALQVSTPLQYRLSLQSAFVKQFPIGT